MVSDIGKATINVHDTLVLILVLMEYGLWQCNRSVGCADSWVLILVLMEYGLWPEVVRANPMGAVKVLILVLMEYGLWPGWNYAEKP